MPNLRRPRICIDSARPALPWLFLLSAAACMDSGGAKLTGGSSDAAAALESNTSQPAHITSGTDSTLCMAAATTNNGAGLSVQDCGSPQALFWAQPGDGTLRLNDKCLDATDGKAADGVLLQLWDCAQNNSNQQWVAQGGQLMWKGHNLCVDVRDGVTGEASALQLWTCTQGNTNQQWRLQKTSSAGGSGGGATTSTTPAQATGPTSTPPQALSGRAACKRGLAADAGAALRLTAADLAAISPSVTWWYNWYLDAGDAQVKAANARLNMDYVQMLSVASSDMDALAANLPPQARYLLTFNEPNFNDQANMMPEQAAALWPKIEKFADQHNLLIVSPAMNYCWSGCNVGDPFAWLDRFFAACRGCRVDHIAVHAYTCDVGNLKSMTIDPFVAKYKRPVWLTEFDCADSGPIRNDVAAQKAYMTASVAALEADPNVFRYAWFMGKTQNPGMWSNIALLDGRGALTELGRHYLALPSACTP